MQGKGAFSLCMFPPAFVGSTTHAGITIHAWMQIPNTRAVSVC